MEGQANVAGMRGCLRRFLHVAERAPDLIEQTHDGLLAGPGEARRRLAEELAVRAATARSRSWDSGSSTTTSSPVSGALGFLPNPNSPLGGGAGTILRNTTRRWSRVSIDDFALLPEQVEFDLVDAGSMVVRKRQPRAPLVSRFTVPSVWTAPDSGFAALRMERRHARGRTPGREAFAP